MTGLARSGLSSRVSLAIAAVVVVLVAIVSSLLVTPSKAVRPAVVPVASAEVVCPNATTGPNVSTQISAVTPSDLATGIGAAVVGTPTSPAAIATLSGGTHAAVHTAPQGSTPVVGLAGGGHAPGFTIDQLTTSSRHGDHGLAGVTCTDPTNDAWFVGTGSAIGHTSQLYLTDPEPTPATVDVELFGANGQVSAPSVDGLVVPAAGRIVVSLDHVAPGAGTLAVHVTASAGRVGAALFDAQVDGLIPQGADWLPVADSPATRVVVPGIGGGTGTRRLTVFAPGQGTATVNVSLIGEQGAFTPSGGADVEIDRGKVTTIDLGPAAASDQTAALVTANVPIVAGVRWLVTSRRISDLAFSAGAPALRGPAVVAGNQVDGGYSTALMLTTTHGSAKISVQVLVAGVPSGLARVITVGADRTVRTSMAGGVKGPFDVVLTPLGGGPLYAAVIRSRVVDNASGTTVAVVRDARVDVALPQARPDLGVGLGR